MRYRQELLQSRTGNLQQSETVIIANSGSYYKVGQLYFKARQILESRGVHKGKEHKGVSHKNLVPSPILLYLAQGQTETHIYK